MAQTHPPIKGFLAKVGPRRSALLALAVSAMCGCVPHLTGAQPRTARSSMNITEISLERDCSGCATGSVLVLRGDGSAMLTTTGKARLGTEDQVSVGRVRIEDFNELARLAAAQGFFDLNDSYEDPQLQDGAWSTTRVVRGGQDKRVFRRDDAGPPTLRTLEAAIERLRERTPFAPAAPAAPPIKRKPAG